MKRSPTQAEWVRRFGKPALILPITGYWLNKIWVGEKKEEYREDKPYYQRLLKKIQGFPDFHGRLSGGLQTRFSDGGLSLHIEKRRRT